MTIKQPSVIALAALFAGVSTTSVIASERAFPSEASNATEYILWALTLNTSQSVRAARGHCQNYCGDSGAGIEVAIDLLGVGGNGTSGSLLNLLALKLDAGAAESRSCQIAKRGRSLIPALTKFDPASAAHWCRTTFDRLRKRELAGVKDVPVQQICEPVKEIEVHRREWMAASRLGRDLFAETGPC